jgi:hypothetical protein
MRASRAVFAVIASALAVAAAGAIASWAFEALPDAEDAPPARSEWAIDAGSVAELLQPAEMLATRDPNGRLLDVVEPDWRTYVYEVVPTRNGVWYRLHYQWGRTRPVFGWAWATVSEPLLRQVEPEDCPAEPLDLISVAGTRPSTLIRCLGEADIALEGVRLRKDGLLGAPIYAGTPDWLASDPVLYLGWDGNGIIPAHLAPGVDLVLDVEGTVVGHFADPRAEDCVRRPLAPGYSPESGLEAVFQCRQHFVVTHLEPAPT